MADSCNLCMNCLCAAHLPCLRKIRNKAAASGSEHLRVSSEREGVCRRRDLYRSQQWRRPPSGAIRCVRRPQNLRGYLFYSPRKLVSEALSLPSHSLLHFKYLHSYATEFDLEAEEYVPLPKGDVHKKKEVVQDVTLHDLDVANARPQGKKCVRGELK